MVARAIQSRKTLGDRVFDVFVYGGVTFALVICLYPFLYVVSSSVSSAEAVVRGEVWLWPKGLNISAYRTVFRDSAVWRSYYNTLWYTAVGTACNLVFTILAAYPLSRRKFFARGFFMVVFVFTMFFSGGMIPTFLVVVKTGLYNSRWAMVIPSLIGTWNLIICRTFFQTLPEDLFESARIEGCSEMRIVWRIVLPLSAPITAVMVLFYGVEHWNSFFPALLYLPNAKLHPIQIYLRRVLITSSLETLVQHDTGEAAEGFLSMLKIKYAVVVVAITPIILLYPFLQRYFVQGVMIGALKG